MNYRIINRTRNIILVEEVQVADSFFSRLIGLMFKKGLNRQGALIFYAADSIHTFFMRFALDILFLDKYLRVKRIVRNLKPCRFVFCFRAFVTIELSSENNNLKDTQENDLIEIEEVIK